MNSVSAVVSTKTTKQITFEKPEVEDGADMWNMAKDSTLDLNSSYKYVMMCEYFSETCVVAKEDNNLVGFVTAFIPPEHEDVVFVWQVCVDPAKRGEKIASKMLDALLAREGCKQIRYLEATVTPSNNASQSLFHRLAHDHNTECEVTECFSEELFPGDEHEAELTFRVGPLSR